MIPDELEGTTIALPPSDRCPIVVITGGELRHDRFALRIQSEFPGLVVAWLRIVPSTAGAPRVSPFGRAFARISRQTRAVGRHLKTRQARAHLVRELIRRGRHAPRRIGRSLIARFEPAPPSQRAVEQRLFGDEIRRLRESSLVEPTIVHDPNAPETVAFVRSLNPYFILTLGGSVYGKALRDCARGLALNQHDGWCPEYRGSYTVHWALYHRDLAKVANTIHILTDGMDAGPILRRSSACLTEDDTLESCFARSVALGTELMCESVRELIDTKQARTFPQPRFTGFTYLGRHLTDTIVNEVRLDLQRNLIRRDIDARTAF
jgi:hypothetical protein